jgi:tripeptidyl-peptidase-1
MQTSARIFSDDKTGWKLQALAAEATTLKLQIALQQNDASGFEQHVLDISTPSHPKYGLHFESHVSLRFRNPSKRTTNTP